MLADSPRLFDTAVPADFADRLPAVQRALHLLFNEGYHGASPVASVRAELCNEAIRLAAILLQHPRGGTPATYALAALMALTAARLPARTDAAGNLIALFEQDRTQWDRTETNRRARYYSITAAGRRQLAVERTEWTRMAAIMEAMLEGETT